jgi:hypothetical protein
MAGSRLQEVTGVHDSGEFVGEVPLLGGDVARQFLRPSLLGRGSQVRVLPGAHIPGEHRDRCAAEKIPLRAGDGGRHQQSDCRRQSWCFTFDGVANQRASVACGSRRTSSTCATRCTQPTVQHGAAALDPVVLALEILETESC